MIRLPAAPLVAAGAAFAAGFWLAWTMQGATLADTRAAYEQREAQYQTRLAESLAEAERIRRSLQLEKEAAINERDAEIERLADAAARIPDRITVRVPVRADCPVPASPDSEAGPDGLPAGPAGRVLRGDAEGLDIRSLRRLAAEADRMNANYRALLRACT